jgi:hypothetical protein
MPKEEGVDELRSSRVLADVKRGPASRTVSHGSERSSPGEVFVLDQPGQIARLSRKLNEDGPMAIDYDKVCFVIMPFGEKPVGNLSVNFDRIYDDIFMPAINAVPLPEGGTLQARRTDKDFFTGDIKYEMYRYLEYSRFALADISGLNFNVAYEMGARHRARAYGTAIFRLTQFAPPFDINSIKAFPY